MDSSDPTPLEETLAALEETRALLRQAEHMHSPSGPQPFPEKAYRALVQVYRSEIAHLKSLIEDYARRKGQAA